MNKIIRSLIFQGVWNDETKVLLLKIPRLPYRSIQTFTNVFHKEKGSIIRKNLITIYKDKNNFIIENKKHKKPQFACGKMKEHI